MVNRESEHSSILRLIHIGFLAGLIILLLMVLRPFITPLMWSVIFAILLHPIFIILNRKFNNRPSLAAFIITILGFAFVLIVIIPLFVHLGSEAFQVIKSLDQFNIDDFDALGLKAETIPIVGPAIKLYLLDTFNTNSNIWGDAIKVFQGYYLEFAKKNYSKYRFYIIWSILHFSLPIFRACSFKYSDQANRKRCIGNWWSGIFRSNHLYL